MNWNTNCNHVVANIRYEDLITNPEKVMRDLIVTRLGLKWDPNVLNFHANNRTVHTHSQSREFKTRSLCWCHVMKILSVIL